VALTSKKLIGVRDPWACGRWCWPLRRRTDPGIGELRAGLIGAEFERDVKPGEVMSSPRTASNPTTLPKQRARFCVFEYLFRAPGFDRGRPQRLRGAQAHRRGTLQGSTGSADIVVPIPDSGTPAALGYAAASGYRSNWASSATIMSGAPSSNPAKAFAISACGASTTQPRHARRQSVVLIDDSIVRGTTSKKIVQWSATRGFGSPFPLASPPTKQSCFYGVDTPNEHALLAHEMEIEEMCRFIGADSLAFVSMDGLYRAMGDAAGRDGREAAILRRLLLRDYPNCADRYRRSAKNASFRSLPKFGTIQFVWRSA